MKLYSIAHSFIQNLVGCLEGVGYEHIRILVSGLVFFPMINQSPPTDQLKFCKKKDEMKRKERATVKILLAPILWPHSLNKHNVVLQELYNKQKKTLATNLAKTKNRMGETYSKFPGFINPPSPDVQHPYLRHITEVGTNLHINNYPKCISPDYVGVFPICILYMFYCIDF